MLNYIWFGLMAVALVVAAFNGTAEGVTRGAVESASETAFGLGIGIIGVLAVAGAVLCAVAVRKPHRRWNCRAAHVPGGALIGAHRKIKHHHRAPTAPQSTNAGA